MGAGHTHSDEPVKVSDRTTAILTWAVAIVLFLTMVGAAFVYSADTSYQGSIPTASEGSRWVSITIATVAEDGTATATINGEEDQGEFPVLTYDELTVLEPGDRALALQLESGELGFSDFERGPPMVWLTIAYLVLVIGIARWRGVGALLGLVAAFGIVLFFTIPALFAGGSPLLIALVTGAGALCVLLYLAHGFNARTTTAYLGTLVGLVITAALAAWAVSASKLTGLWSEEGVHYELAGRGVSLQGILLCGIILAGLGILNDVTVTQASAVWELRRARPDLGWRGLYRSGMRIGRDHIASTVYTIAFAYVGAALPLIMLVTLYQNSLGQTLTAGDIAEEVVRTLVGSIGLVLAMPVTTLIGALVAAQDAGAPAPPAASATMEA